MLFPEALKVSVTLILLFSFVVSPAYAAAPSWWATNGVLKPNATANDYAAINQGQLKQLAAAAYDEFARRIPGGAGPAASAMVANWFQTDGAGRILRDSSGSRIPKSGAQVSDFAPVNLGQLKTVAKPFYDRLIAIGFVGAYPWQGAPNPPNDFAMANIGQAKFLFSFDLTQDSDHDGVPDITELTVYHTDPRVPNDFSHLQNWVNPTVPDPTTGTHNPGGGSDPVFDGHPPLIPDFSLQKVWDSDVNRYDFTKITLLLEGSNTQTGFWVERKTDSNAWTAVATVSGVNSQWTDDSLTAGHQYLYRVRAVNQWGVSAPCASKRYIPPMDLRIRKRASEGSRTKDGFEEYVQTEPPLRKMYLELDEFDDYSDSWVAGDTYTLTGGINYTAVYNPQQNSFTYDALMGDLSNGTTAITETWHGTFNGTNPPKTNTDAGKEVWKGTYHEEVVDGSLSTAAASLSHTYKDDYVIKYGNNSEDTGGTSYDDEWNQSRSSQDTNGTSILVERLYPE